MRLALLVLALVMLSACATSGETQSFDGAETAQGLTKCLAIDEDDVETNYGETVTVATILGGAGGALIGTVIAVVTRDPSAIAAGAIAGAGFGAAEGAFSGVKTANQMKAYAVQEAQLDCQLATVKEGNERLSKLTASLNASLASNQKHLEELEELYVSKRVSKDEALKNLSQIDDATKQIERTISAVKKRRQQYIDARNQAQNAAEDHLDTTDIDKEIEIYNEQIHSSEEALQRLMDRRKVTYVG